jgi:glycosyltransferase involved in cell wall biosynthesis
VSNPEHSTGTNRPHRFGFVMEQALGHVTHYTNLRFAVEHTSDVDATWYLLEFPPATRVPFYRSNWSLRASWLAWRELAGGRAEHRHDAVFFHTQASTLLSVRLMRRVPSVISLDATPMNYDSVGVAYGHRLNGDVLEGIKRQLNRRSLRAASALVTWCDWARRSLIEDYGVDQDRIAVIPPGVNLQLWPRPQERLNEGPIRVLFVGGDFERKGGGVLLRAFSSLGGEYELHLITNAEVPPIPNVFVYRDVAPNSDALRYLYATADIFVLPTVADCFPLVIQEAMSAGLPVIATDVGAISEAVTDGKTGVLVPPGDARALRSALETLSENPPLRRCMGQAGREVAERHFDSVTNGRMILDIMEGLVDEPQG